LAGISENKDKFAKIMSAFDIPLVTVTYKWHVTSKLFEWNMEEKWEWRDKRHSEITVGENLCYMTKCALI
jgi:hypothetical protein